MKKLILIAALAATAAHAEFKTGNDLLADLNDSSYFRQGIALGYIMGAHDTGTGVTHCAPATVTAGQVQDMVKRHLDAVPSARHLSADSHVTYVLSKAWPCPKRGSGV